VLDTHCKICLDEDENGYKMAIVTYGATYINGGAIPFNTPSKKGTETPKKTIRHKDIIMIGGRSIRFEYPAGHPMTIRRRSSRSDFITILKCK